jgi:flagellar motility protein MotE (MotC chaperone)
MNRIWVVMTGVLGFLGVWFGLTGEVDPSGRSIAGITDELAMSRSQAEGAPAADPAATPAEAVDGCLPRAALGDLADRRKELEKKEAALLAREQDLAAREKATQEELKKIQQIRSEIDQVQGARTKESDERVARIVEVLEAMNPKAASQLIATYDERLAVQAMGRMSTPKLSKILNVMEPKRSVKLMELLAGGGTSATSAEAVVPNTNAVTK